jgi:signal transduction histidine kinase
MTPSIQKRLFAILGLFVIANTLLWSGLAMLLAYVVEDEIIDRVLASEISRVQEVYLATGELPVLSMEEIRLYPTLQEAPADLRQTIHPGSPGGEIFTDDETHYHYRWLQFPGLAPMLLLAEVSPWLVVSRVSPSLYILLLLGFGTALLFGLVAVFFIARITTQPIRELTAAIEERPRPVPLPHRDKRDEVGVLASAMDTALQGLEQALSREREFTRDVSHELRTPLTTLRNAITLLPDSLAFDSNALQLAKSSDEIANLLEALLALARAESSVLEALPLRAVLEDMLIARAAAIESQGFEVSLEVSDSLRVDANAQVTRLILGNLLDNAMHYAQPRRLSIVIEQGGLVLENPLDSSIQAPHAASLGQGLSLVQRLAQAQSWRFSQEVSPQRFIVRLMW